MTPEQITYVKSSWSKVEPIADQAADLFYTRLFEVYPEVKPYFKGDMGSQGKKLMAMLGTVVGSLDNLEPLLQTIRDSGKRHAGYGVQVEDYDKVADALLWTLEKGLGDAFSEDVKQAWVASYAVLAGVMKEGAEAAV